MTRALAKLLKYYTNLITIWLFRNVCLFLMPFIVSLNRIQRNLPLTLKVLTVEMSIIKQMKVRSIFVVVLRVNGRKQRDE